MPLSPFQGRHPIRVVLSSTALLPFLSVRKAAALALAQSGVAAFFIAGVTWTALGASAGWFVLAVTALAVLIRAIDIESWALLIAGGFVSRVTLAFGARAGRFAAAAALIERLLLGTLASVVAGHYVAAVAVSALGERQFTGHVRPEDLATLLASAAIGLLWDPVPHRPRDRPQHDRENRVDGRRNSAPHGHMGRDHGRVRPSRAGPISHAGRSTSEARWVARSGSHPVCRARHRAGASYRRQRRGVDPSGS